MALRTFLETTASRFYTVIISGVITLAGAKLLGPSGQGTIALLISWAAVISQVVSLSLPHTISYHLQRSERRADAAMFLVSRMLIWSLCQSILGLCIFNIALGFWGADAVKELSGGVLFLASLLIPGFLLDEYLRQACASIGSLAQYNRAAIFGRSLALIFLFSIYVFGIRDISFFVVLNVFVPLATLFFLAPEILSWHSKARQIPPSFKIDSRVLFVSAMKLYPNSLGSYFLVNNGVIIAGYYLQSHEVGWFQMGLQLAGFISLASQPVAAVIYSKLAASTPDGVWLEQRRYVQYVMAGICSVVMVLLVRGSSIVPFLLGERWRTGAYEVVALTPVAISMAMSQLMAPQWISRGFLMQTAGITIATAILSTLFNLLFIPRFGLLALITNCLVFFGVVTLLCQAIFYLYCNRQQS